VTWSQFWISTAETLIQGLDKSAFQGNITGKRRAAAGKDAGEKT